METVEAKVFKIPVKEEVLVFIPQLAKVYKTDSETAKKITEVVTVKKEKLRTEKQEVFPSVVLRLTDSCNLHCAYCQEKREAVAKTNSMPWEIAKAAMDYLFKNAKEETLSLNFLGGEATLEWELLKASEDYFRRLGLKQKKKTLVGLTTNGCFVPYKADWLALNMNNILLALDGTKAIQDAQRDDSFDLVFENARKIYEKAPAKLQFRTTISAESVERLPEIVAFLGKNFPGCRQSYEPLFETSQEETKSLKSPAIELFFDKFLEALPSAQKYGSRITASGAGIKPPSVAFCGTAETNFIVTCEGRVLACNQGAATAAEGGALFEYGHFEEKKKVFIFDKEKQAQLVTARTEKREECSGCYARFNCGGTCQAEKGKSEAGALGGKPEYSCEEMRGFAAKLLKLIVDKDCKNIF